VAVMEIKLKQINYNVTATVNRNIQYIVIHDTGNKSKGSNAEMHYRYFNSGNKNASADFFVDDGEIIQTNNYWKFYTWQCGDGKGQYGITNRNSIGIEMCVNSDGDYNKMFNNTIWLVKFLMQKLKIPIERVVRHYDASRKNCPASMSKNSWQNWHSFKKLLIDKEDIVIDDNKVIDDSNEHWSILKIQIKLNQTYPYKLKEDGIWGDKTKNAVKHFQKKYDLEVDGLVGPITKKKINEIIAKIKNSAK